MSFSLKKYCRVPHTYVILAILIMLAAFATHFVPAGEFDRNKDPLSGKTVIVPGTYHQVTPEPTEIISIPVKVFDGLVDASDIMIFILIIGGTFKLIERTNMINCFTGRMALKLKGREAWSVPIFLGIFSIGGFTMGMSSEVLVFVPIGIAMARSLGFDVLTGTAMVTLGANVGYTAGLMNPFGVGLAQMIAGVPLFSGMWLRAIFLVLIIAVTSVYILRYAYRVRSDPSRDLLAGVEDIRDDFHTEGADLPPIERYHWFVLLVLAAGFGTLIWGVSAKKWWIPEMGGIFMMMGILSGFVAGYGPSKIAKCFGEGAKELVGGAITVGLARGIMVVMNDAHIVDTIVYGLSNLVGALPMALQLMGLYAAQILISLLVVSSTGQAAITMPILTPLADLLGVTRQTAVLIFQFSDGFTNNILPTSSATMGALSVARIPYAKWLRFMMPLLGIWLLIGGAFILAAQMIGYR